MATVEYRSDPRGLGQLLLSPQVRRALHPHAQRGAAWIKANAPVDTGTYRNGVRVVDAGRGGRRRDRAAVNIEATAPHSVFVEHGSHDRPGHRLLARSIDIIENG